MSSPYRIWAIVEKEMHVYFKYFHSEVSFAVLFPVFMIWTMGIGLGDAEIGSFTGWDWLVCVIGSLVLPAIAIWWFA